MFQDRFNGTGEVELLDEEFWSPQDEMLSELISVNRGDARRFLDGFED